MGLWDAETKDRTPVHPSRRSALPPDGECSPIVLKVTPASTQSERATPTRCASRLQVGSGVSAMRSELLESEDAA